MQHVDFYPEITPYETGMMPLDHGHVMYWEQSGNPKGVPVVVLHGGPGAGSSPGNRRFFDPSFYRIIVYDQRGSGKSTPLGETNHNTTPDLIADMEKLRQHLKIERWLVFGGSWGSTLAIAYGEHHPDRCLGLVLRGIFLCRRSEVDWFLYGMRTIFPEQWDRFSSYIPEAERGDFLKAYHKRLMDPDPKVHMPAAKSWSMYEGACATLLPSPETVAFFQGDVVALGLARMEAHYFINDIFLPENFLLNNVHKLHSIPTTIVQGRYDIVCPIVTADDLVKVWPQAEYIIVPDANHSALEPGIKSELIKACDRFKKVLG